MSPEAQKIAIAEACGWKLIDGLDPYDQQAPWCWWTPENRFGESELSKTERIPNYLTDLNAMHEAEKVLTSEQQCARFARELALLVKGFAHDPFLGVSSYIWHATAAQRAEAFIRTLGKWQDGGAL